MSCARISSARGRSAAGEYRWSSALRTCPCRKQPSVPRFTRSLFPRLLRAKTIQCFGRSAFACQTVRIRKQSPVCWLKTRRPIRVKEAAAIGAEIFDDLQRGHRTLRYDLLGAPEGGGDRIGAEVHRDALADEQQGARSEE